jgi:hypothetical protein
MAKKHRNASKFLEELENVPNISLACKKTGLSRQTVYRWCKEEPDFKQEFEGALKSGIESVCDLAESKLIGHINGGSMRAIQYWLDNHKKEYIRPRPKDLWEVVQGDNKIVGITITRAEPREPPLID